MPVFLLKGAESYKRLLKGWSLANDSKVGSLTNDYVSLQMGLYLYPLVIS